MATTLASEARSDRGKNVARRLRRSGRLPAVVYGGDAEAATAISVDPEALMRILRSDTGVNTLIGLQVDAGDSTQVLIKDYQVNPLDHQLLHVDFYRVSLDQGITVAVPIVLHGEAQGVKLQGGIIDFIQREISIECLPTEIPEHLDVDVSELMIGQGVRLRDLLEGVSWKPVTDADTLLVHVVAPRIEEEETADADVEGEGEGEGEGEAPADGEKTEKADDADKSDS